MSKTNMPAASSSSDLASPELGERLLARLLACWRLKVVLGLVLLVSFCVPYFLIGNYPLVAVHTLPTSWIDRAIGFHPDAWVWIYQSIYLVINIVPWFSERRDDLMRYLKGFALLSSISFAIFIFYPIRAPRPDVLHPTGMHRLLLLYDVPLNSLPSLHAGLLVYTLAYGKRILADDLPDWLSWFFVVWAVLILYGTLATKEHYFVDIVSGAALALMIHAWIWGPRTFSKRQRPIDF